MNALEIRTKASDLKKQGKIKREFFREMSKPDIDGVRKIIQDNPRICLFEVNPNPARNLLETLNFEEFFSSDDEEFSKEARLMLCEGLGIK